jgi:hypothetical protein
MGRRLLSAAAACRVRENLSAYVRQCRNRGSPPPGYLTRMACIRIPVSRRGMSRRLLKLSGGSSDDYATRRSPSALDGAPADDRACLDLTAALKPPAQGRLRFSGTSSGE